MSTPQRFTIGQRVTFTQEAIAKHLVPPHYRGIQATIATARRKTDEAAEYTLAGEGLPELSTTTFRDEDLTPTQVPYMDLVIVFKAYTDRMARADLFVANSREADKVRIFAKAKLIEELEGLGLASYIDFK